MAYVRADPSSVDTYYQYLVPEYREEIYRIFCSNIKQAAARANTRSHYQGVCATIRTLKKAGGKKEAQEAVRDLLLAYPRRPAMRDELRKLKLD
jgi:FMN phosphatase YigB (HAD superfamily)